MRLSTLLTTVLQSSGASIVAPTITSSGSLAAAEVGIPQTWSALAANAGGGTVTWSIQSGAPTGLSINASTGVISGTPSGTVQTYSSIVVRATNEAGYDEETFSMVLAYTPKSDSPTIWQRADQSREASDGSGSAPANGAPIGYFPDLSGNGYTYKQTVTGPKPTYVASAVNSKPALQFDGVEDMMVPDSIPSLSNTAYLVLVISRSAGAPTQNNIYGGSGTSHELTNLRFNSTNRLGFADTEGVGNIFNATTWGTSFHCIRYIRNGTNVDFKVGSTTYSPNTVGSGVIKLNKLGHYGGLSPYYGMFTLAEVIAFNADPGSTVKSNIETYINSRYGLTV